METKEVKANINKCGNGGINIRVPLPKEWANKLNITKDERDLILVLNENEIIVIKNTLKSIEGGNMKNKIGQIITVKEDFEIKTLFGNKDFKVKKGDKGFIDSKGLLHYSTGEARGKIQAIKDCNVEGFAHSDIARLIFNGLDLTYDLKEVLQGYDVSVEEFINDIEDILIDIL